MKIEFFVPSTGHQNCLDKSLVFWSFWNVSQFNLIYSSCDIENFEISSCKVCKKRKKHFLGTSACLRACLKTPMVNTFLGSFLGVNQLYTNGSSYDMKIIQLHHYNPKKRKIVFLGHFRFFVFFFYNNMLH